MQSPPTINYLRKLPDHLIKAQGTPSLSLPPFILRRPPSLPAIPRVVLLLMARGWVFYLRLNRSGDRSASRSRHLSRVEAEAVADDRMNIGLVNDFVRREEPPPEKRAWDSDNGKKLPLRRKNGDFMPR